MQITIDLPDNLPLTEADVQIELAMVLDQQYSLSLDRAAQLATIINLKAVPKYLFSAQILSS
jgi:hypothetical protein